MNVSPNELLGPSSLWQEGSHPGAQAYMTGAHDQLMQWIATMQNHLYRPQQQIHFPASSDAGPSEISLLSSTFTPADDGILARALYDCQANGTSYKQAIESLHLVSGGYLIMIGRL